MHLLRRQAMYACTHETGGGFVAGGVRLGVSRQRSRCFLAKLGLQYGCCNLGWNEFCRTHVFPANRNKMKSRRADSNRWPHLFTSLLAYVLARPGASGNYACIGGFRRSGGLTLSSAY